jgi:hypothetical protein
VVQKKRKKFKISNNFLHHRTQRPIDKADLKFPEVPVISFKISRFLPDIFDIVVEQKNSKFFFKPPAAEINKDFQNKHTFYNLLTCALAAFEFGRYHESLAFLFDILLRDDDEKEPADLYLAWGLLGQVVAKLQRHLKLAAACLRKMKDLMNEKLESHRLAHLLCQVTPCPKSKIIIFLKIVSQSVK